MRTLALALIPALIAACTPREDRLVAERTETNAAVIDGNNAFAVDVYDAIAADEGNVFVSPFSISSALSMTWAGARGATEAEMATVLHAEGEPATWHAELGALTRDLSGDHQGRGYTLHVANKLFGQAGYPFEQPFLDTCAADYDAPLHEVDYIADPEASRQTVNDWVAEQTRDHIDELFPGSVIDADTRMVLANAIYFQGDWAEQFDPADTADSSFTLADGRTVQVPLMQGTAPIGLGHVGEPALTVGRLPYLDDEVSMWVLLPAAPDGLPAVEAALTPEALDRWFADAAPVDDALLVLPKFELRYDLSLKEVLSDLGMPTAFDPFEADFSGIADAGEPLHIQDVIHETYVQVDEEGTRAAAATGVSVGTQFSTRPSLVVDRPFLFLIRDDLTGTILFLGRVVDPR